MCYFRGIDPALHEIWAQLALVVSTQLGPLLRVMSNSYQELKSDISQTYGTLFPHSSLRTNSAMCCKALVHPSHQEVKSCNILNWAECQPIKTISIRSWARTRFAYSSGTRKWNPARSQIDQTFSQSELFQPDHDLKLHLHIGQLPQTLEFSILQPHGILFRNTMPVKLVKIII